MSCPRCGENCCCSTSVNEERTHRFVPSSVSSSSTGNGNVSGNAAVSESKNATDQHSRATRPTPTTRARFVVQPPPAAITQEKTSQAATTSSVPSDQEAAESTGLSSRTEKPQNDLAADSNDESALAETAESNTLPENAPEWRKELASRLQTYHSRRRRRPPRYPSLNLKFESPQRAAPARNPEPTRAPAHAVSVSMAEAVAAATVTNPAVEPQAEFVQAEFSNVIEFPRPLIPPSPPPDQLAEPILDKPRILEAPETVPKQVPLGGIVLEPQEAPVSPSLELPLQVAPLSARIMAAAIDATVVLVASAMFALIASQLSPIKLPERPLPVLLLLLPAGLWVIYQYLLLTFAAATPGLHVARLQLNRFEGGAPSRRLRRWRAVAMALSAVSLGLGFLWSFLDEDTLCWHDRISHTYLTSVGARRPTWMTHAAERMAKLHSEIRDAITGALPQ